MIGKEDCNSGARVTKILEGREDIIYEFRILGKGDAWRGPVHGGVEKK